VLGERRQSRRRVGKLVEREPDVSAELNRRRRRGEIADPTPATSDRLKRVTTRVSSREAMLSRGAITEYSMNGHVINSRPSAMVRPCRSSVSQSESRRRSVQQASLSEAIR
jgi:hypothetical protein